MTELKVLSKTSSKFFFVERLSFELIVRAKNIQDKPLIEEHKARNDSVKAELMSLRTQQLNLSRECDDLKVVRQTVMEQAVSELPLFCSVKELHSLIPSGKQRSRSHFSPVRHIVRQIASSPIARSNQKAHLGNDLHGG